MSDILQGPQLPLRPSLTEEQFICQHLPALLRYLIPLIAGGLWAPMESTHSLITPKSIKWVAGEGSWRAQEQVSALNSCNQLLTEESRNGTVLLLWVKGGGETKLNLPNTHVSQAPVEQEVLTLVKLISPLTVPLCSCCSAGVLVHLCPVS